VVLLGRLRGSGTGKELKSEALLCPPSPHERNAISNGFPVLYTGLLARQREVRELVALAAGLLHAGRILAVEEFVARVVLDAAIVAAEGLEGQGGGVKA